MERSEERSPLLSVVVPAWNEEDGIAAIVERVLAVEPALQEVGVAGLELIVVDDGSSDGTADVVRGCEGVRLVCHETNRGYGAALKTGFHAAQGDLLAFLDADGTYPPEHFPALCREALDGAELVVGSRRSGADSQMPLVRRVGNLLWSNLVTLVGGRRVVDPASGMRVFHREALERLYPLPDGLNFTPVMSTRAIHEGVRLREIPIPYTERVGRSKLSVVEDGMRFLRTIIWTALNYNPVRILGGLGVAMVALAGILAAVLVGMRLAGITTLGPWGVGAAFAAVVLGIAGVDTFALGVTFNYLVSLFHKRPIRQGLFGEPIFQVPLDRQFWWMGLVGIVAGLAFGAVSLALGLGGWPVERLWLYLLAGTMLVLVGTQLVVFWVVVRVLEELSEREAAVEADMACARS
ncbi:MAG: glycosyltransferase family 2 protein [Chloroflexota bacterium]|nr:glycosyltransferase family 2 protein [Chloroflexota bacterium]